MKNYKSPGPYGFHPLFFKSQWEIIGSSLHQFVVDCFQNPKKISEVNQILISLIPKWDTPARVSQFRPIALCNVVYKVVTKVITQRLSNILPYIVCKNQSSFIPGKYTSDNILVMQESILTLNNIHGK